MGQSPSIPSEHARLIFSSNSLRNTQIECDALGLHYQLSTPSEGIKNQRTTSITRWDPLQEKDVLIADSSQRNTSRKMDMWWYMTSYRERMDYRVECESIARHTSLKLYEEGSQVPIAEYGGRHCLINKRKAHIRLAPGCDEILDYLVLTCVITERKRRDAKRRQRSSSGGGGSSG
ncbi:hypothetical protein ACEPAG_8682 [Sanghuangporus baumii]